MVTCPSCGRESAEGFQFCPHCGAAMAVAREQLQERKLVTILFADVTGSTQLGEQLDPERLQSLMSTYFAAMRTTIEAAGGTVEKFIGDAVMAVFGSPVVREDDPERALRAALAMQQRLAELNTEFEQRHGLALAVRIGVNTGEVIAPVGERQQRIIAGDPVNVAARLEQAAEPGTVLVGERTYLAVRDAFEFASPLQLSLKGKTTAQLAYPLLRALPEARRGIPGLGARMIGRSRELETLLSQLQEAVEAERPRLVVVYGPAGIGKSRLVREFVATAEDRYTGESILRGRCLAIGRGVTYWALAEILRQACGIGLDEPAEEAAGKLDRTVREVVGRLELRPEEVDQTVFALATTAGIALPDNPLAEAEPRTVADALARAWPRFAIGLARTGPLVLVVEDLHWAEERLLEMLQHLLARSVGPIFLVATARPEFAEAHPTFAAGRDDASTVSLQPLSKAQSAELVEALLAVADMPDQLRNEIVTTAEGNPFFVEEILRRLMDEGALVREAGGWRATPAAHGVVLPDTIHGLLAARVDSLAAPEKRALQEAAVVGRVFWEEPVAQALGDGTAIGPALLALEQKGLIFARPTSSIAGQLEFSFKHALVRDVAYSGLPKTRRAKAHAELAGWMERMAGDRLDEMIELLAYHYASAVAGEDVDLAWASDPTARETTRRKAVESLLAAGAAARQRFAVDQALAFHQQAVTLAQSGPELAAAWEQIGDDHVTAFHGDDAVDAYRRSLALLREHALPGDDLARVCANAAWMMAERSGAFRQIPDPEESEALVREGLAIVTDPGVRAKLLAVYGSMRNFYYVSGGSDPVPIEQRIARTQEAIELSRASGKLEILAGATQILADLYGQKGDFALSLETSLQQRALVEEIQTVREKAAIYFQMAASTLDFGASPAEGLEFARRSHELARDLSPHDQLHASFALIEATYQLGRWDELEGHLDKHLVTFERESDVTCFAVRGGPIVGALALAHRGDRERAERIAERIAIDPNSLRPFFVGLHVQLAVALGRPERGRELAERVLGGRTGSSSDPRGSVRGAGRRPRLPEMEAGDFTLAVGMCEALVALEDWTRLEELLPRLKAAVAGAPIFEPFILRGEAFLAASRGERDKARAILTDVIDRFERLGMPFETARSREALAGVVDGEEANRLLELAAETYSSLKAEPHLARVRSQLASTPARARRGS